jgi:hypothetical protein
MASARITNDLLNITVGIKLENGVSTRQVRSLINEFVPENRSAHVRSGIHGFLWVEDVPDHLRTEFLTAVSTLSAQPDQADAAQARTISANAIW